MGAGSRSGLCHRTSGRLPLAKNPLAIGSFS